MKKSIYKIIAFTVSVVIFSLCVQTQISFAQETEENPVVEALFKSAEAKADEGKLDAAIADYDKILKLVPNEADAFYGRGYVYLRKADYDKAISDFTKTLEIKPDDFYVFFTRGKAYFKKGDYENSIADHDRELELQPSRDLGRIERGNAYLKLKQFDEAFADYNRAMIGSEIPAVYLARGLAFLEKGDNAAAIGDLRYYLEKIPDDAKARETLIKLGVKPAELPTPVLKDDKKIPAAAKVLFASAMERMSQAEYNEAIWNLTDAIKVYPQFAAAYFYRGYANDLPGSLINHREIQADYTAAIKLDPKFAEAYTRRGYNEFYNTQSPKAVADLNKAVLLDPKSAQAVFYRGRFAKTNAKKLLDFNLAIKLNPNSAEFYLARGEFFEETNKNAQALADYSAVLKLNPNDYRAYAGRAKVYCKLGKKQLAAADENKLVELGGEVDSPCNEN